MTTLKFFNQKPVLHIAQTLERTNSDVCKAQAYRIRQCNGNNANYIAKGMFTNDFGRKKDGLGSLQPCGSKICPSCVSKSARRNYRKAEYILNSLRRPKFLTLTFPDRALVGLSMDKQLEFSAYVYRELYRHSNFFQNKKNKSKIIRGTVKAIEFTDEDGTAKHPHYQLICDSDYINKDDFLVDLNKAVKIACNRFGLKFQSVTNFFVKTIVKKVTDEKTQISKIEVNRKVARYLTKPQNWHTLKPNELIEMVENETKHRMFATTGTCAKLAKQFEEQKAKMRERRYQRMVAANVHRKNLIVPTPSKNPSKNPVSATPIPATSTSKQPKKQKKKSWRYRIKNKLITLEDYKKEFDETHLIMCEFRMKQLMEKYFWVTDWRTLDGIPFETTLRYIEQDKKRAAQVAGRAKRVVYDADKNARLLFPELQTQKPASVVLPVVGNGFIGNRKPQPAVVYNF